MDNTTLIMGLISVSIIIGIIFLFKNNKKENKSNKNDNSNKKNNQRTDNKKTISNKKDNKTSKNNTETKTPVKEKDSFKETVTIKPLTEETVRKIEEEQEKENPILKIKEAKEITTESLLENVIDKIREDRYKTEDEIEEETEEDKRTNYQHYEELEHKVIENEDEIKVLIKEDEEVQNEVVEEEIQLNNNNKIIEEVEELEEVVEKNEVVEEHIEEPIKKEVVKEFNTDLEIPFSPTIKYDEFDISVAVDELGMEEEEIEEFVIELVEQADQALEDLEKMYLSKKFHFEEMEKITHKIKGSATSLRVKGLADVITEFNTYLKNDEETIKIETIRIYIKDTKYYLEKLKEILF